MNLDDDEKADTKPDSSSEDTSSEPKASSTDGDETSKGAEN